MCSETFSAVQTIGFEAGDFMVLTLVLRMCFECAAAGSLLLHTLLAVKRAACPPLKHEIRNEEIGWQRRQGRDGFA